MQHLFGARATSKMKATCTPVGVISLAWLCLLTGTCNMWIELQFGNVGFEEMEELEYQEPFGARMTTNNKLNCYMYCIIIYDTESWNATQAIPVPSFCCLQFFALACYRVALSMTVYTAHVHANKV